MFKKIVIKLKQSHVVTLTQSTPVDPFVLQLQDTHGSASELFTPAGR